MMLLDLSKQKVAVMPELPQQIHDVNKGGTKRKVYYNIHQAHLTYAIRGHKNIKTVMTNYLLSSITQIGVLTYLTGNVVWLVA